MVIPRRRSNFEWKRRMLQFHAANPLLTIPVICKIAKCTPSTYAGWAGQVAAADGKAKKTGKLMSNNEGRPSVTSDADTEAMEEFVRHRIENELHWVSFCSSAKIQTAQAQ
jgi:hypothetical protein